MALAVCLTLDDRSELAVRRLWGRLESVGVRTLLSHTHGEHLPHLTYASLRSYDLAVVSEALEALPAQPSLELHFDGFGTFRRSRCWLAPAVDADLVTRQLRVVETSVATGAELHHHYRPGLWVPHLTVAPRARLADLPVLAAQVYDVLPLDLTADAVSLIDTSTGRRTVLRHLV